MALRVRPCSGGRGTVAEREGIFRQVASAMAGERFLLSRGRCACSRLGARGELSKLVASRRPTRKPLRAIIPIVLCTQKLNSDRWRRWARARADVAALAWPEFAIVIVMSAHERLDRLSARAKSDRCLLAPPIHPFIPDGHCRGAGAGWPASANEPAIRLAPDWAHQVGDGRAPGERG